MVGFIYRRAFDIKEFGERLAHVKISGIRPLIWASSIFIGLGLAMRDWISKYPIY